MRKRFILLIDFSESSLNLLKYAADWAIKADADIMLVHRTTVLAPALTDVESRRQIATNARAEAVEKLMALAEEHLPKSAIITYSVSDDPLRVTIANLLAQPFQDLVLVGLKRTHFVKKLVVGSVALDVINNTGNCIVAVPKDVTAFTQSTFHVSVTEKYLLNILELNNYLKFLAGRQVKLVFFSLAGPEENTSAIEKQLRELSELFAYRFETDHAIFEGADAFAEIKKIVTNRNDEVLVVQRGSRMLTDHLFRKFLIDDLVYEGHIPLVVLP